MRRTLYTLMIAFCSVWQIQSQETVKLYEGVPPGNDNIVSIEEKVTKTNNGSIDVISEVTIPTLTAYLPEPSKATGTAVVILPGGALRFLSWDMEGVKLAKWLNEKGIATFILKYRLANSSMKRTAPTGAPLRLSVFEADKLVNANANPLKDSVSVKVIKMAAEDTRTAIRLVRENAAKWNINPRKIGCVGFSAGGGVELSAAMHNTDQLTMPGFMATIYGPALEDVVVPTPAPPLFIATCADHMNVAAGCLALFETWKKAGGEAEIHLYGKGKGGFGMIKQNQPSDEWVNSFYTWLISEGF